MIAGSMHIDKINDRTKSQAVNNIANRTAYDESQSNLLEDMIGSEKPNRESNAESNADPKEDEGRKIAQIIHHSKADARVPNHDDIKERQQSDADKLELFMRCLEPVEETHGLAA